MREFKFRAWVFSTPSFGVLDKPVMHKPNSSSIFEWDENGVGLEIMQAIGMPDKTSKEIFEKDIVKVTYANGETEILKVAWDGLKLRYILLDVHGEDWGFTKSNDIEIIGNVFENPELFTPKPTVK